MRARGVLAAVLAATALGGCSGLQAEETHDLTGIVNVMDMHIREPGVPCAGARPFLYLRPGATVVVRDLDGDVLAEGEMGEGEAVLAHEPLQHLRRSPTFCRIPYEVRGLPPADTYEVRFGDGHSVTFGRAELEEQDWFGEVTLP